MATDLGLIISYKMGTAVDLLLFIHTFSFYSTNTQTSTTNSIIPCYYVVAGETFHFSFTGGMEVIHLRESS